MNANLNRYRATFTDGVEESEIIIPAKDYDVALATARNIAAGGGERLINLEEI